MAKFTKYQNLRPTERQKLMVSFCEALTSIKNAEEAAKFLSDLLSPQECQMLAKRLKIADLLLEEKNYEEIKAQLRVGFGTIARVNTWLNLSGEGYKLVIKRSKKTRKKKQAPQDIYDPLSWRSIKRRYSAAFWPQLMVEEMLKQSDRKHQERLITILRSMENKTKLFKDINKQVYESYKDFGKTAKTAKKKITKSRTRTKGEKSI